MTPRCKLKNWIQASGTITSSNKTITIPHAFSDIDEFHVRILGTDQGTFGYYTIPQIAWHVEGTYELIVEALVKGSQKGFASLICQNKKTNSFEITLKSDSRNSFTAVVVYYKLKNK